MERTQQIKIYTWKYDNGAYGYAVRQIGKKKVWLEQKSYGTKREVKQCLKKYKKSGKYEKVKCKKVYIPGGLNCMKYRYEEQRNKHDKVNGFEAFNILINSCGTTPDAKREILRLAASVLAGYCVRQVADSYMRYLPPHQRRVPMVAVRKAPFADVILWKIMQSLALNTTESDTDCLRYIVSGKTVKCKYTRVLPPNANEEAITDSAYLRLQGSKERMLPQYRDTAIMIYDWFLHGKICRRIQLMNRWVCLVIYGASRKKFLATPVEIDGYQLAKSNGIWDEEAVRLSVIRYAGYICQRSASRKWRKMVQTELTRYDAMMDSHNENCKLKIKAAERYQIAVQLLALHLFLKSCMKKCDLDKSQAEETEQEWFAILLPGNKMSHNLVVAEEENTNSEQIQNRFEAALTKIIKTGFPNKFYMDYGELKEDMWGDFRNDPKDKTKQSVGLRITVEKFKELLNQFDDGQEGGTWLYEQASALQLSYMKELKKERVKATADLGKVIYLPLEKMTFLPEEVRTEILERVKELRCSKRDKS